MKKHVWFFVALFATLWYQPTKACTNILVTKGAAADGSTMITYAADSHTLYGELYFWPAAFYPNGTMLDVYEWDTGNYLGKIKQASQTYQVVGNMNEHQLTIAETTFGGREELQNTEGIIDYGSLIYITLQRAKTAREAITIMDQLVQEYGYYSTGESFSIADPNEVWIMDMIGKGKGEKGALWVAMKVPDGYISAHANQSRIGKFPLNDKANCLYAADVIKVARDKGWFTGSDADFSFYGAYAPIDYGALRFCEARVWSVFNRAAASQKIPMDYVKGITGAQPMPLWIKPDKKLSVSDVMELMRDHYEGSDFDMTKDVGAGPYALPYRWRPLTWKVDDVEYCNERAISTQQTGFSFVSQARSTMPNAVGGLLWFGVDDTYSTAYIPFYASMRSAPHNFAVGTGSWNEFTWESAFWVFNFVSNYAYLRYSDMIQDVQKVQRELEGQFLARQSAIEDAALKLYQQSPELARDYLTKYSHEQAEMTVTRWRKLGETLIFKYLDGNVKNEKNEPMHPAHPEPWKRSVIQQTGDHFKMRTVPGQNN